MPQVETDEVFRSLEPLDFHEHHLGNSSWSCFCAPKMEAGNGRDDFPDRSLLTSQNVDEWAEVAVSMRRFRLKARFNDALWELGNALGSGRKDRYRFGRMAADS